MRAGREARKVDTSAEQEEEEEEGGDDDDEIESCPLQFRRSRHRSSRERTKSMALGPCTPMVQSAAGKAAVSRQAICSDIVGCQSSTGLSHFRELNSASFAFACSTMGATCWLPSYSSTMASQVIFATLVCARSCARSASSIFFWSRI